MDTQRLDKGEAMLTVAEAADALGVSAKTVQRWSRDGLIPSQRTLGGHRRFRLLDVKLLSKGCGMIDSGMTMLLFEVVKKELDGRSTKDLINNLRVTLEDGWVVYWDLRWPLNEDKSAATINNHHKYLYAKSVCTSDNKRVAWIPDGDYFYICQTDQELITFLRSLPLKREI